jgi:hypothetical protein
MTIVDLSWLQHATREYPKGQWYLSDPNLLKFGQEGRMGPFSESSFVSCQKRFSMGGGILFADRSAFLETRTS